MTNPAEQFKANLKAKEDANKERLEEHKVKINNKLDAEQARMNQYSDSLRELIPQLTKWAESGGLKVRKVLSSYVDFNKLVSEEALFVSYGQKEIRFVPAGVERAGIWIGTVQIELQRDVGFHQLYLALDFDKKEQKYSWIYVDYLPQRGIVNKCPLDESFFFKLMEEVFMND